MAAVPVNVRPPTVVDVTENKIMDNKPQRSSPVSTWCSANWRPILAELVSTSLLVFFGCMACIPIDGLSEQSPYYGPLGFGLTVLINIQIFGHISMAHMNPAVTLAGVIFGNTTVILAIWYFIAQMLGAMIGYGVLMGLAPIDLTVDGICVTRPHLGLNIYQTLGIEVLLTASLSLLNCGVWDPVNQHKQDSVPVKFGLAIFGLSIMGGPLTGASMNPARSFGPALWTGVWIDHWAYWVGPFIGAGIPAIFYKVTFLKKDKNV